MMSNRTSQTTFWERLIVPHPSVQDSRRRRRARVLSGLSLVLLIIGLLLTLSITIFTDLNIPFSGWMPHVLLLLGYILSRTPRPEIGAGLLTFGQQVATIGILVAVPNEVITPQALIFVVLPVLLSMLLMTAWYTITLAILSVAALLVMVFTVPWLMLSDIVVPFSATVLLTALAGVAAFIRERDINTIEQRTEEVSTYSEQLEQDVQRITATAQVGRAITATRDLDTLLKQVVELIREEFGYYHAQVFLVDEAGRFAVLRESTGEAGEKLLKRGHKLAVGSQSVIGRVTAEGEAVIAADTDVDPVHRRNELLPYTRAEMALPLQVAGRVIGALDVQSVEPDAFGETEVSVFQTMADQLAVAIENARLFERAQRDLRDIERLNRQLTGEAWRQYMSDRNPGAPAGYRASAGEVKPLNADAVSRGDGEEAVSVPLRVRGETIGKLDIEARDGSPPDEETRQMIEAVAERVALALDSTRLSEQAQRQAAREQILSRLSAELQASTDLDVILRIAAREASRALDAPRGFVHLTLEFDPTSAQAGDRHPSSD